MVLEKTPSFPRSTRKACRKRAYFNQQRDLVQNATQQISQHKTALNSLLYGLFSLS
jgi:hypothetical protein